jgi:hypothetical protein
VTEVIAREMESWRQVVDYEGDYSISDLGRIRRDSDRTNARAGTIHSLELNRFGYMRVTLFRAGKSRRHQVHRLVYEAFCGPIPDGLFINHIDGNKRNNTPGNLEIVTAAENNKHAVRIGLMPTGDRSFSRRHPDRLARGNRVKGSKLDAEKVKTIRWRWDHGETILAKLANEYGVTPRAIRLIVLRQSWTHV